MSNEIIKMKASYLKMLPLFGVVGAVCYFLHVIIGNIFNPDYNPMAQAISDLTAQNSPSRNIALPFSFLYGIFTTIFSIYFFAIIKQKINKFVTFGSAVFFAMTIVSFFGYTFFPLSEPGYAATFKDKMHLLVTAIVVAFTIISLILFSIGFSRTKLTKHLAIISLSTLLLIFAGAISINLLPNQYFGIAQRIAAFPIVIYTGILSVWVFLNNRITSN